MCLFRTVGGMIVEGCAVGGVIVGGGFVATAAIIGAVTNMTCVANAASSVRIASYHLSTAFAALVFGVIQGA